MPVQAQGGGHQQTHAEDQVDHIVRCGRVSRGLRHLGRVPACQKVGASPRIGEGFCEQEWLDGMFSANGGATVSIRGRAGCRRRSIDDVFDRSPKFGDLVVIDDPLEDVEPMGSVGINDLWVEATVSVEP